MQLCKGISERMIYCRGETKYFNGKSREGAEMRLRTAH